MAAIVLGQASSVIGGAIGGPLGALVGYGIGTYIGGQIDKQLFGSHPTGTRLAELNIQTSTYGKMVPIIYGSSRIAGNVIWSRPIEEHIADSEEGKAGADSEGSGYYYTVSLAIAICEGPIEYISRAWADAKDISWVKGKYRLYKGDEAQLPDPLIESFEGKGKTTAFRGLAYIVIEDFPLAEYGNKIPNFTFEVKKKALSADIEGRPLEEVIKSMVIIPGSGEFVYDSVVQSKIYGQESGAGKWLQLGKRSAINQNSLYNKADAIVALDQMQETCPNLEWVAPVVTWFGDNLNAKTCQIKPGVEYKTGAITSPDIWNVAGRNRRNAYQISRDKDGNPNYGGTVNDLSVLRYLTELRNRKLKITFYPMFFMDIPGKPWRGRVTGNSEEVREFFIKPNGYNEFIIHYANLVKEKVDAFVIGSELIGLTKVKEKNNVFPAVEELTKLAAQVKKILGQKVIITYAADWSEYHHTEGGWYNLDQLWASPAIDVVGIDAYFPLTEEVQKDYDPDKAVRGWESGEGYDFYYVDSERKTKAALHPAYAWKNIEWWWKNEHINPNQQKTPWVPRSKKIWFTEYGFPSLDGACNQPNVFYSPGCVESYVPRLSRGRIDIKAQRQGLIATEKKWLDSEMIEQKFVWTWDARPYPFWPALQNIWRDAPMWASGHWVNGKLNTASLGAIVRDLCIRSGLKDKDIDVFLLNELVHGYILPAQTTARAAIEDLQKIYFFEIVETNNILKFLPRVNVITKQISENELVVEEGVKQAPLVISRTEELELASRFDLIYIAKDMDYQQNIYTAYKRNCLTKEVKTVSIPVVLDEQTAKIIAEVSLYNDWIERIKYEFALPPSYTILEAGDIIELGSANAQHLIRITNIAVGANKILQVKGIATSRAELYNFTSRTSLYNSKTYVASAEHVIAESKIYLLDLPKLPNDTEFKPGIFIAACGVGPSWRGVRILYSLDNGVTYDNFCTVTRAATIGVTNNVVTAGPNIDHENSIEVMLLGGELESYNEQSIPYGANLALVGDEIVQFVNATLIAPNKYKLSKLYRGKFGTEHFMTSHQIGERFILLNCNVKKVPVPSNFLRQEVKYKVITIGGNNLVEELQFTYTANELRPSSPANIILGKLKNGDIAIKWENKYQEQRSWFEALIKGKLYFSIEIASDNQIASIETRDTELIYSLNEQQKNFGRNLYKFSVTIYAISNVGGKSAAAYANFG